MEKCEILDRSKWQKNFVQELCAQGLSHDHAMIAMGLCCEYRQIAYMQGYNRGYNIGIEKGIEKEKEKK